RMALAAMERDDRATRSASRPHTSVDRWAAHSRRNRALPAEPGRAAMRERPPLTSAESMRERRVHKCASFAALKVLQMRDRPRLLLGARAGSARKRSGWCRWMLPPNAQVLLR